MRGTVAGIRLGLTLVLCMMQRIWFALTGIVALIGFP